MTASSDNEWDHSALVPWLRDVPLPADPREQIRQPAEPHPAELPAWLDGITDALPVDSADKSAGKLPAWLAGLDNDDALVSGRAGAIQRTPPQAPPTNWRERQQPSSAPTPTGEAAPAMPEWLARIAARRRQAAHAGAAAPAVAMDAASSGTADLETPAIAAAASDEGGLPAWLRAEVDRAAGYDPLPDMSVGAPQNDAAAARTADTGATLDWLRDIEEAWAADAARADAALVRPAAGTGTSVLTSLPPVTTLVPEWLQPPEPRRSPPPVDPARAILQRAGLLPPRVDAGVAGTAVRPTLRRSTETQAAIAVLTTLTRAEQQARAPQSLTAVVPPRWVASLAAVPFTLLLLLAVMLAAVGTPQGLPAVPPPAITMADRTAGLSSEQVVLLALEWGPQRSAQLQPLVDALVTQLVAQDVRIILLSTDPAGAVLAGRVIERLAASGYNRTDDGRPAAADDLVFLGYLPGAELAVRSLSADLLTALARDDRGQDARLSNVVRRPDGQSRLTDGGDLAAVFVIADQPGDVQTWMEQWWVAWPDVPLTFVAPPDVTTQALAYRSTESVALLDTAASDGLRDESAPLPNDTRWLQLIYVAAVVIGLAIATGLRRFVRLRGAA